MYLNDFPATSSKCWPVLSPDDLLLCACYADALFSPILASTDSYTPGVAVFAELTYKDRRVRVIESFPDSISVFWKFEIIGKNVKKIIFQASGMAYKSRGSDAVGKI